MTDPVAARLAAFDACAVSDALDSLGLEGTVTGLIATLPGRRIAGRVRTLKLEAGKPAPGTPPRHLGAASIDASSPGDVIVVEQRTGIEAGSWGGLLARAALQKGIAAVISEGALRDVDEAREIGFPVFCRGFTAFTARGRVHEAATDIPVRIGAVTVETGDYVLADSSACVFVRPIDVERVIAAAARIAAREAAMIARIEADMPISTVLGADYEHMLDKQED
ncbi:MAG: RraA family protein [Sphingomonas sp.]